MGNLISPEFTTSLAKTLGVQSVIPPDYQISDEMIDAYLVVQQTRNKLSESILHQRDYLKQIKDRADAMLCEGIIDRRGSCGGPESVLTQAIHKRGTWAFEDIDKIQSDLEAAELRLEEEIKNLFVGQPQGLVDNVRMYVFTCLAVESCLQNPVKV